MFFIVHVLFVLGRSYKYAFANFRLDFKLHPFIVYDYFYFVTNVRVRYVLWFTWYSHSVYNVNNDTVFTWDQTQWLTHIDRPANPVAFSMPQFQSISDNENIKTIPKWVAHLQNALGKHIRKEQNFFEIFAKTLSYILDETGTNKPPKLWC